MYCLFLGRHAPPKCPNPPVCFVESKNCERHVPAPVHVEAPRHSNVDVAHLVCREQTVSGSKTGRSSHGHVAICPLYLHVVPFTMRVLPKYASRPSESSTYVGRHHVGSFSPVPMLSMTRRHCRGFHKRGPVLQMHRLLVETCTTAKICTWTTTSTVSCKPWFGEKTYLGHAPVRGPGILKHQ